MDEPIRSNEANTTRLDPTRSERTIREPMPTYQFPHAHISVGTPHHNSDPHLAVLWTTDGKLVAANHFHPNSPDPNHLLEETIVALLTGLIDDDNARTLAPLLDRASVPAPPERLDHRHEHTLIDRLGRAHGISP